MKKYLLIICLFCSVATNAQKVEVAISIGLNISDAKNRFYPLNEKAPDKLAMKMYSFNVGIKLKTKIDEKFDFKTGLLLNQKGFKTIYYTLPIAESDYYVANNQFVAGIYTYLDIPFLLSYKVTKHLDFNFGTGFNLHIDQDKRKPIHAFDIPATFGFSYNMKRTAFDIQYSFGTIPFKTLNSANYINDHTYTNYFHRQIVISINQAINKKINGCLSCKSMNKKF